MNRKHKSRGTNALLASMAELEGYVKRGMTAADIAREIAKQDPRRVRRIFRAPEPGKYSPSQIRALREAMNLSQATFAQVIGVSGILVQSWERGVRAPSPLARRMLDTISSDPAGWLASLARKGEKPRRRAG
jgi:DNA-binding transcriptional regulator YiaG